MRKRLAQTISLIQAPYPIKPYLYGFIVMVLGLLNMANANEPTIPSASNSPAKGYPDLPSIRQTQSTIQDRKDILRIPTSLVARPEDRQIAQQAWDIITSEGKTAPRGERKLHVIYVTFTDLPALKNYRERYDRIMKQIQLFYADQMAAYGLPPLTFALDLDEQERLIIHDIPINTNLRGKPKQEIMGLIWSAADKVFRERGIDINSCHFLTLCHDGEISDFAEGSGSYQRGFGRVWDRVEVDTLQLLNREYHGGPYKTSFGKNASIYIGTAAHELGHVFGLAHTGMGWEYLQTGASLMGTGNYNYGETLRNEGKGTCLTLADVVALASRPLFNGLEVRKPGYSNTCSYQDIVLSPEKDGAKITGSIKVDSENRCYAIVAHWNPKTKQGDYFSNAAVAIPDQNGKFTLTLRRPGEKQGIFSLKMTSLFVNGDVNVTYHHAWLNKEGVTSPDLEAKSCFYAVTQAWMNGDMEKAKEELELILASKTELPIVKRLGPTWEKAWQYNSPQWRYSDEAPDDQQAVSLVDIQPKQFSSGFGSVCWDTMLPSELGPQPYMSSHIPERFIMLHAQGHLAYELSGKWNSFQATVGVPLGRKGTITAEIRGDGKTLFSSKLLTEGNTININIPVEGVNNLTIEIKDGNDGNTSDWAIIGEPLLSRNHAVNESMFLGKKWLWHSTWKGNPTSSPAGTVTFLNGEKIEATSALEFIDYWESISSTKIKIYRVDYGDYWIFEYDPSKKEARSIPEPDSIKDIKVLKLVE